MKTSLPQAPAFRDYLATAHDGAKQSFTPVGFEIDRLRRMGGQHRVPGQLLEWPVERPLTAESPLELLLEQLRGEPWVDAVLDDGPLPEVLEQLQATAATARAWFNDMRPAAFTVGPDTGLLSWLPGLTVCRLPAATHREALRFAGHLRQSWPWHVELLNEPPDLRKLQAVELQFADPGMSGELVPLRLHHLVALLALHLVVDAADVLTRERDRLHVEFIKAAPRVRFTAGWRSPSWRAVSERLQADDLFKSRHWHAVRGAQDLLGRAEAWLRAWHAAEKQREEEAQAIESALVGKAEEDREARRLAAVVSAKPRAKKATQTTRVRVTDAWEQLAPERRDRWAVSMLAKRLGLARSTVSAHLKAAGLYVPTPKK